MKISYGKLAAIAILTLMLTSSAIVIAPRLFTTSAFTYPPGTWRIKLQDLGNNTVPAGSVTVYLWNNTEVDFANDGPLPYPAADYLVSYAKVGANGIVSFPGLPGDTWNDTGISYAISANYTLADGTVTDILVLPLMEIYQGSSGVHQVSGLAKELNTTDGDVYYHFTWLDGDEERPGYIVYLAPVAFRVVDEAGFPLVGAGVDVWANVFTNVTGSTGTEMEFCRLDTKVANGTFGNEFIGNLPIAVPFDEGTSLAGWSDSIHNVGWVNLELPALFFNTHVYGHGIDWDPHLVQEDGAWTGLENITLLIRYKTADPTIGPIVGRFSIVYINTWHHVDWSPVYGDDADPMYDDVDGDPILAYSGAVRTTDIDSGEMYPYVRCNVRWTYSLLLDIDENPWYTKDAEKWLKWAENPVDAYMYPGVNVAPGLFLLRFPVPLEDHALPLMDIEDQYNFHLIAGVEWHFSVVSIPWGPADPEDLLWGSYNHVTTILGTSIHWIGYGVTPGPEGDFIDFLHNDVETGHGIGMEVEWTYMYRTEIKLDSSTELPQALRDDVVLTIILPAGVAMRQNATIAWETSNTGFVLLPDTEATRHPADPYVLWGEIGDYTSFGYYHYFEDNVYGWLPSAALGETNFMAWYQGIKVLDTTVVGGFPAGNLPPAYRDGDFYWDGEVWHPGNSVTDPEDIVVYKLNIFELGFVLEFSPAPNGDTRPVPWYTPFFFRAPNGMLVGPTLTQPAMAPWDAEDFQTYGVYELVKAVAGGTYSDFMIIWKGAVLTASNIGSIYLNDNMPNVKLVFQVYDLNVTGLTQDPDVLINVKVQLFAKTDFSEFGIPYYMIRSMLQSGYMRMAILPNDWVVNETIPTSGFPIWEYATEPEYVVWSDTYGYVLPAMFTKLPAKDYDIWIAVCDGIYDPFGPLDAGFRSVDENATLYWTRDPWIGAPYSLTGHANLDISTYVYNPRLLIEDAGGAPLELAEGSQSAIFLVEPWYDSTPNFWDQKVAENFNPYFVRINETDATGRATLYSVNASVLEPVDPNFNNRVADDFPDESRYLVGTSTFLTEDADGNTIAGPAPPYRFMVYYEGVLVFNESVPLKNPYVSKDHEIVTSVYPYIFKVTDMPLPDETWRFGIQNLDVDVSWAGLNLTWWPSFSLVTETAVKEFSLLNASKLEKGFNMSVLERLWGPTPTNPVTLIEIPYTPVPPYFCSNLFVENGVSDVNGEFKVLVPVWNYSYSNNFYTYMATDDIPGSWGEEIVGGPACAWYQPLGPVEGINLLTWGAQFDTKDLTGYFGTPVFANWTTIPGTTNNIPADDDPRLAATLEPACGLDALNQSLVWPWVFSVNATGLVNTESYYDGELDLCKSLTTNEDARLGGIGILSGGVFQGRQKVGVFEDTVVGPPQPYANFYAKLQVQTIANDIGVIVLDCFYNDLPNQYVEVWDETNDLLLFHGYTSMTPDSELDVLSTPTNIFWGFYDFSVSTTNLTQIPTHELEKDWELDPQWLVAMLSGGDIDWTSGYVILQWPTKLQLTIYAGDGARYLHNAWAFIVDGVNNENVTAALTDDAGYPGSIDVIDPTLVTSWADDPLATGTPEGSRLNLGFNLGYEGYGYEVSCPEDPFYDGTPYYVFCTSGSGKWIVKVFWKAPDAGVVKTFGKVEGVSVWDTFRDQPQHRYIYLGIDVPPTATGEDNATAQVRTFSTKVYDLKLTVLDQSPSARAITSAPVTITMPDASPAWVMSKTTSGAGEVTLNLVPAGKYQIVATSPVALYGKPASQITASVEGRVIDGPATILVPLPIFDATVTLVTPSGKPIVGATMTVGGVSLGMTDASGDVLATSIPSGSYTVTSSWFGQDISPTVPLTVTLSRTYLLTASKIALVQIQVVGAQNQGLPQAAVTIKIGTTTVFTGMTNNDGVAALELPYGTYTVTASHKGVEATATIDVTGDTVQKITTGVFIELFGQGLTFAGFALWVIAVLIVVLILVIAAQEYNIYRRKRLPQLFGAGPTR